MQRYWVVRGYRSTEQFYEKKVKAGVFTENKIQEVLKALVAKESLSEDDIVGAYAKNGTRIKNVLLDVRHDPAHGTYACGSSPTYFTAQSVEES